MITFSDWLYEKYRTLVNLLSVLLVLLVQTLITQITMAAEKVMRCSDTFTYAVGDFEVICPSAILREE